MRVKDEEGQAVVFVALAMSIFLIGAIGLAFDGSHLYSQRQMAQTAADSAAIAGMMSVFNGTNGSGATAFTSTQGTSFTCSSKPNSTPCNYAKKDGFALSSDTVTISFPADSAAPGVGFASDATHLIQVTVQRSVNTTLMRFLGPTATTVQATAMAAIVSVVSPTPILVTDPTNNNALSMNGSTTITICGGPSRSIEVNSSGSSAYGGGGTIDLSKAGPADPGDCTAGTGASFGVFGGSSANPGSVKLGTTGQYVSPASPVQDPLANVAAPTAPTTAGTSTAIAKGTDGCSIKGGCIEYSPGLYASGLIPGNNNVIFKPGLYYVSNGGVDFKQTTGGGVNSNAMCVGCAADADTGTGMVIYDTGPTDKKTGFANSGGFTIDTLANLALQGATLTTTNSQGQTVPAAPYYGILFFEDRNATAQTHQLGQGNGCFSLIGTIYITNTLAIMQADSSHTQKVEYNGTPCSATINQGDIIVGDLTLKGNTSITMNLVPYGFLQVRQVALVQ